MLPSGEKQTDGPTLSLVNVSRLDGGSYICSAANGVDGGVQTRIRLKVICENAGKGPFSFPLPSGTLRRARKKREQRGFSFLGRKINRVT